MRDAQGRKMSKSLGNGIDPLEVIDQYGADALRFTLATGNSPGNDMRFSDEKVRAPAATSANKIWNASRFILMNLTIDKDTACPSCRQTLPSRTSGSLSKFNTLVADVTRQPRPVRAGSRRCSKLYDFIWEYFCDWYIELVKDPSARAGDRPNVPEGAVSMS